MCNIKVDLRKFIEANMEIFDYEESIKDDDNIFEKGFVNSIFAMRLLQYIEDKYNIIVNDDEISLNNFSSIDNIVSLLKRTET
ncbi:phosphopantetheine-binding protein [Shouchella hunanensis]|uniref:Phosphopantetheine-binding protein n=1 Tax=Shouchella hunanensis TaxID=766894 RepID=A0ABY7VZJ9_9BACI|nr:phosphopantetheine-binding protein [Shouchella hunanensis]WDF02029.1 phosphopantetheine-binding protein [Shouchella hunanensis]